LGKVGSIEDLFRGRHFDREVIILCVRWNLRYKLSYRDLMEMMAERGLDLAHTTILRWVRRYASEFVKRWNRFGRSCGRSWRVDETYIKVRGEWVYLYRAVDKAGQTIDFRLSKTRDVAAAKAFFKKAVQHEGRPPQSITLDGYAASHRAVRELRDEGLLPERMKLRFVQVSEQPDRAGSSWHQVKDTSYARLQKLYRRRQRDCWHRTSSPHP
jgi:transposase-like protein